MATFQQHTYERRQELNSHWTIEDMVYGKIGANGNSKNHAINHHFSSNAHSYEVLPMAVNEIKQHWNTIISPHPVDFEDLYARVENLIGGIKEISLVTIYDISLNIGCNLYPKVLPEKKVYLTAGKVRSAAEILVPAIASMRPKPHAVDASLFSKALPYWSAIEIEDILCVYSKQIQAGTFTLDSLKRMPNP